jgi:alpha,alpha-trehalase
MWREHYKDCLEYIDTYWNTITFKPSMLRLKYRFINIPTFLKDKNSNPHYLFVPHSFFVPNTVAQKKICYWDTFFMFRGLMGTKREWLMQSMVENFIYLFNLYQIIPNLNTPASINRSQPPFLSSMILDTYFTPLNQHNPMRFYKGISASIYHLKNRKWLRKAIALAKKEYEFVWIDKGNYYNHHVKGYILSRYGDRDIGYAHSSELESGWDFTSRFFNRCDCFLPVDLNCYLYKYEKDFARLAKFFDNADEEQYWEQKAIERKQEINKYMWKDGEGFFYDYDYEDQKISVSLTLAGFTPMWAGVATLEQAKKMVKKLHMFESPYGLTVTAEESLPKPIDLSRIQRRYHPAIIEILKRKQWDYPNIWSPMEYLTVIGLLKYGFIEDARRIMEKSVKAHAAVYRKHKTFFEKLDGETGERGRGAEYGDQEGFGWTNAIFYRYIQLLDSLDRNEEIYNKERGQTPPYDLAVLH